MSMADNRVWLESLTEPQITLLAALSFTGSLERMVYVSLRPQSAQDHKGVKGVVNAIVTYIAHEEHTRQGFVPIALFQDY